MFFMCLCKNSETLGDFNFKGTAIKKTDSQKLLRTIIKHKLNFEKHIKTSCQTSR